MPGTGLFLWIISFHFFSSSTQERVTVGVELSSHPFFSLENLPGKVFQEINTQIPAYMEAHTGAHIDATIHVNAWGNWCNLLTHNLYLGPEMAFHTFFC